MCESELEPLLALDGAAFEMAPGVIVEFLVLRSKTGGQPWLPFDNAHGVAARRRSYRPKREAYDH